MFAIIRVKYLFVGFSLFGCEVMLEDYNYVVAPDDVYQPLKFQTKYFSFCLNKFDIYVQ